MFNYALITPARNEESYIKHTLQSVVSQTIPPVKWVIVSDNSTDRTDAIVSEYEKEHSFIKLVRVTSKEGRNFGAQVRAFLRGFQELKDIPYNYIGNLDADVSFEKDYYQKIHGQFLLDEKLGLAGGFIFEDKNGTFLSRKHNSTNSVAHAVQMFKRECFDEIGGYVPLMYGGSDSVAEIMARMSGWKVRAYPWLEVRHHKPTNGAEGMYKGAFRQGLMDYSIGNSYFFEFCRCLARVNHSVRYFLCRYSGFLWAGVRFSPREVEKKFMKYLREEQQKKFFQQGKNLVYRIINLEPQPKIGN